MIALLETYDRPGDYIATLDISTDAQPKRKKTEEERATFQFEYSLVATNKNLQSSDSTSRAWDQISACM